MSFIRYRRPAFRVAASPRGGVPYTIMSMTRQLGLRVATCLAVSLGLLAGGAVGASADGLQKIIVFQAGTSPQVQQQVVAQSGSQVLSTLPLINGVAIKLPTQDAAHALALLQVDPRVTGIYEDLTISGQDGGGDNVIVITPADPPPQEMYPWGLEAIRVPEVHAEAPGLKGAGVAIAILDTGIDTNHPDLSKNIKGGYNAIAGQNPQNYQDDNGHGTHMAGIIAGRMNRLGVIGVAYQAKIVAVKVLDQYGAGRLSDLINGLGWIRANKIRVVNMSLGFSEGSPLLEQAIERLYEAGIVMVASVGNGGNLCAHDGGGDDGGGDDGGGDDGGGDDGGGDDGGGDDGGGDDGCAPSQSGVNYPARYTDCIAVGATRFDGKRATYSTYGTGLDVVAPGGQTNVDQNGDGYGDGILQQTFASGSPTSFGYYFFQGTSMATPHVAAIAALVRSVRPGYTRAQVRAAIESTCRDLGKAGYDTTFGNGLVNALGAVTAVVP